MKISINEFEYKNNQHEIAVILSHPKKETNSQMRSKMLFKQIYISAVFMVRFGDLSGD